MTEAIETERPLLLVEDDLGLQRQMRWALEGFRVSVAGNRADALRAFTQRGPFPVVILDLGLPPDENGASEGLATLADMLEHDPSTKIIIASGNVDRANAVRAVGSGAYDFFGKPVDIEMLRLIIDRAFHVHALEAENRKLREGAVPGLHGMIAASGEMLRIAKTIERVATTDVSILLLGESGTGKEVIAQAIHHASRRREGPLVAINCASIPDTLLESELFGHEKGAFTGSIKQTAGKVEIADGGTLFLDEVGDMPLPLQAKMLRFLQDRSFERIGGRKTITVDVRVISATNRDLTQMIAEGSFRQDLYFRLDEIRIEIPPLRARPSDVLVLAKHFLGQTNTAYGRQVVGFAPEAISAMNEHPWPGNVRELQNRVKRAVVMADGKLISAADLGLADIRLSEQRLNLREESEKLERLLVQQALATADGNISKAAQLLGISRPRLYQLRRSLGI